MESASLRHKARAQHTFGAPNDAELGTARRSCAANLCPDNIAVCMLGELGDVFDVLHVRRSGDIAGARAAAMFLPQRRRGGAKLTS